MEVWIGRDGERHGPYKEVDVRQWLRSGQVSPDDLGWYEGMADWAPLSTLFPDEARAEAPAFPPVPPATPYAPPASSSMGIGTNLGALDDYAGFWKRVGAYMLDAIVLYIPNLILTSMLVDSHAAQAYTAALQGNPPDPDQIFRAMGVYLHALIPAMIAQMVLQWLYFALMESSPLQATVGKLALGIRVTDLEGRRIGFLRATGRYFGKVLNSLTFCIGFLMVAWTKRSQGLHDMLANTLVLNGRVKDVAAAQVHRMNQGENRGESSFNA